MRYSYHVVMIAAALACARATAGQEPAGERTPGRGAVLTGVVYDSVTRQPLAGATVQLANYDSLSWRVRSTVTDRRGRFRMDDVADGTYLIGFLHPMLDSLTMEPIVHQLRVVNHSAVRVALGIPSPQRMRDAVCGPRPDGESGAAIIGVVRDHRTGLPAADVDVRAEWNEVAFTSAGPVARTPTRVSMTAPNGFFALCDLPTLGTVSLVAGRGADSAAATDVTLPADRFARHDLWLEPGPVRATRFATSRPPD